MCIQVITERYVTVDLRGSLGVHGKDCLRTFAVFPECAVEWRYFAGSMLNDFTNRTSSIFN